MIDELRQLLRSGDSYAVAERIQRGREPRGAAELYAEAVRELFWKAKDVAAVVTVGRMGIVYALTQAIDADAGNDAELATLLRGLAKQMAYNVASFTWPGWDEPGVTITDDQRVAGYDAARLDLRLAIELKRDASKLSTAHWMLAAHHLSAGKHDDALASFEHARGEAHRANEPTTVLMCEAYAALTRSLASPDDARLRDEFDGLVKRLRESADKDGTFYADQLATARRYFTQRRERR